MNPVLKWGFTSFFLLVSASAWGHSPEHLAFAKTSVDFGTYSRTENTERGIEFGGGFFFSERIGIALHALESPGNGSSPVDFKGCTYLPGYWSCPVDNPLFATYYPEIKGIELTFDTEPISSWMAEALLRWEHGQTISLTLGLGLHYSKMEAASYTRMEVELPPLGHISRSIALQEVKRFPYTSKGALASIGLGFAISDRFELSLTFRNRFGDLEPPSDYDDHPIKTDLKTIIGFGVALMF